MGDTLELAVRAIAVGVGATMVMDLWAALLRRFGVPSLNMALLGRWVGSLRDGRWRHRSIVDARPIRGEAFIGWCAHYSIGVLFSAVLLVIEGLEWARQPSVLPALCVGVVTATAPLFILQPGMGAGIASRRTSQPLFNSVKSVVTHAVFGLGMYGAAVASVWLLEAYTH